MFDTPRFYQINGDQFVSVTTFLKVLSKPFLMGWAVKEERKVVLDLIDEMVYAKEKRSAIKEAMHELCSGKSASDNIAQTSAEFGRKIHKAIEQYVGGYDPYEDLETSKQKKVFKNWLGWWEDQHFGSYTAEEQVHSTIHRYAGTLDLRTRGCIWDWKTGKGAGYPEQHLQNVAYRMAHNEAYPHNTVNKGVLIHIPSSGDPVKEIGVKHKYTEEHVIAALCLWKMEHKY